MASDVLFSFNDWDFHSTGIAYRTHRSKTMVTAPASVYWEWSPEHGVVYSFQLVEGARRWPDPDINQAYSAHLARMIVDG